MLVREQQCTTAHCCHCTLHTLHGCHRALLPSSSLLRRHLPCLPLLSPLATNSWPPAGCSIHTHTHTQGVACAYIEEGFVFLFVRSQTPKCGRLVGARRISRSRCLCPQPCGHGRQTRWGLAVRQLEQKDRQGPSRPSDTARLVSVCLFARACV